jgi:hypothetical protein
MQLVSACDGRQVSRGIASLADAPVDRLPFSYYQRHAAAGEIGEKTRRWRVQTSVVVLLARCVLGFVGGAVTHVIAFLQLPLR